MTVRFASNPVPFARRTIALPAGHVLTPAQVAQLVAYHTTGAADVAVVCKDRPTLLAITKAFRAAVRPVVAPVYAAATTEAPVLHPVRPAVDVALLQAQLADAKAEIEVLTKALAEAVAPKPKARRSRAKAVAQVPDLAVKADLSADAEGRYIPVSGEPAKY